MSDLLRPSSDGDEGSLTFPVAAAQGLPTEFVFTVVGDPVPWTSAVKMGHAPNSPRKIPDRQAAHMGKIVQAWNEAQPEGLWLERGMPVEIECEFLVTRPKSTHYGSGRNAKVLKDRFRDAEPTGKPDLSNLVKMVEDSLTNVIWADDDQVTYLSGRKLYIDWWEQPRSVIRVRPR